MKKIETIGLITQSRIIRFLFEHKDKFPRQMKKHVKDFHKKKVISVTVNEYFLEAFNVMRKEHVTGLAIVDNQGKLVGKIAASDLSQTDLTQLVELQADLHSQIRTFMNVPQDENKRLLEGIPQFNPVFVHEKDTLETALEKIIKENIHRIFVVDSHDKPVNVLSLGDIIGLDWFHK